MEPIYKEMVGLSILDLLALYKKKDQKCSESAYQMLNQEVSGTTESIAEAKETHSQYYSEKVCIAIEITKTLIGGN
jgi:hypothetical protein